MMTRRRRKRVRSLRMRKWRRSRSGPGSFGLTLLLCTVLLLSLAPAMAGDTGPRQDGNDTFATADEAKNDEQVLGELHAVSDPDDYFWIQASKGQVVDAHNIALDYNWSDPDDVDFDLEIYGPLDQDTPVANDRTKDQIELATWLVGVTGRYYIRLHAVSGNGSYAFTVKVYDPEELIDNEVVTNKYLKQNSNRDTDWYKFNLDGGNPAEAVKIVMTHDDTANMDLFLVDLWSEKPYYLNLSWWMGPPKEEVYGVAAYTGSYYLKVQAWSGWGDYQLDIDIDEAPTDGINWRETARFLEYNTTWTDRVDMGVDKYDFFEVRLQPGEEVMVDLTLMDTWDDIYSVFVLDHDLNIILEKTNYIFEPQHDTGKRIQFTAANISGGVYYVVVMAKVALENPDDLSDGTAAADYTIVINMSKHAVRPPNRAPKVRPGQEDLSIEMMEDEVRYLDLNNVFEDPDGDKLAFTAMASSVDVSVSVDMSGTVTVLPKPNWHGAVDVNFTAKDPAGLEAWLVVNVTVKSLPEPPQVYDYGPMTVMSMDEGGSQEFYVKVMDEDSPVVWFNWSLDGASLHRTVSNFTYKPDYDDASIHVIEVEITDGLATVVWDWDVTVNNTNRLPVVTVLSPENGTKFKEGEKVNLKASVVDPDDDPFSYEWREGLQVIGKGTDTQPDINHSFPPGKHTVRLSVVDGEGGVTSRQVEFKVTKEEEGPNWGYWLVGLLVAVIVVWILYAVLSPSKRTDEDELDEAIDEEIKRERKRRKGKKRAKAGKKKKGKKGRKKRKKKSKKRKHAFEEGLEEQIEKEVEEERRRRKRSKKSRKSGR
jgi:hypothetical protein